VSCAAFPGIASAPAKGPCVDQPFDALTDGEPAAIVLALHLVGTAHLLGHRLATAQLVHLGLPAHLDFLPPPPSFVPMRTAIRYTQTGPRRGRRPMDETGENSVL